MGRAEVGAEPRLTIPTVGMRALIAYVVDTENA